MRTRRKNKVSLVDIDRNLSQKWAQCWVMSVFLFLFAFGNLFFALVAGSGLGFFIAILLGMAFWLTIKSAFEIRKLRKQLHENPESFRNKSGEYSIPNFGALFWLQR